MSPKSKPTTRFAGRLTPLALAGAFLAFPGCKSVAEFEVAADEDVYEIVAERRRELGEAGSFTIAIPEQSLRQRIMSGQLADGLDQLSLIQCQRIAAENSRDYQARRESLYLAALDLTLERFEFGYRADANGGVTLSGTDSGAEDINADSTLTFRKVMGNGASVVLDLGVDLFSSLAHGDPSELFSSLGLTITKPLLAGSSKEAIFDSLTRAERRVVDQARTYERFRRTFAVDMFGRYWRILEEVAVVENEELNAASLVVFRERQEALEEAGRLAAIELGQALQDEFRARTRVVDAHQRLDGLLDDFKFFMGLPVDTHLSLDSSAFEAMKDVGITPIEVAEEDAVALAIASRFDLATDLDEVSDAERSLRIAEDDLGTSLDLTVNADADSQIHGGGSVDSPSTDWSVGLDVNFPVDRMSERNSLRAAQISLLAARRTAFASVDGIRVDIRDDLRRLDAAEKNFEIAVVSLQLAERRVEGAELQLAAGDISTRDVLETREDLLQARNARISALVDFKLAKLDLFLDMEQLDVDEGGVRPRQVDIVSVRETDVVAPVETEEQPMGEDAQNTGEPVEDMR